jgi:hypothetical protein
MLQLDPTERECSDEVRSNSEVRDSSERILPLTTSKILGSTEISPRNLISQYYFSPYNRSSHSYGESTKCSSRT